jgi:hypothetical protein
MCNIRSSANEFSTQKCLDIAFIVTIVTGRMIGQVMGVFHLISHIQQDAKTQNEEG